MKRVFALAVILLFMSKFTPSSPDKIGIQSGFTPKALAQSFSIEVSPPVILISANPGTQIKKDIILSNKSQETIDLDIQFSSFVASDNTGTNVIFRSPKESFTASPDPNILDKVTVLDANKPIDSLTLLPFQKKTITLIINLPADEPASDYYLSLLFLSPSTNQEGEDRFSIITRGGIATHVLLSIGPRGPTNGSIEAFSSPLFAEQGPVDFLVSIRNKSNHFITPKGRVVIRNLFGQAVESIELPSVTVLAQSSRLLPIQWNESFLLGVYTAELSVSLSSNGPDFTQRIRFFAFPIKSFGMVMGAFVLLFFIRKRVSEKRSESYNPKDNQG